MEVGINDNDNENSESKESEAVAAPSPMEQIPHLLAEIRELKERVEAVEGLGGRVEEIGERESNLSELYVVVEKLAGEDIEWQYAEVEKDDSGSYDVRLGRDDDS